MENIDDIEVGSKERAKANLVVAKEIERKRLASGKWKYVRRDKNTIALIKIKK